MSRFSGVPNKNLVWKPVPPERLDLSGKRIVVVGGTGGIGRALSMVMADRGAQVTIVGRTFRDVHMPRIGFMKADQELMSEAQRIGQTLSAEEIDLIVFTTGIMPGPKRQETSDGIERDLAVSYLSRLVMIREIGPRLSKTRTNSISKPRVFVMGMPGTNATGNIEDLNSEKTFSPMPAHMNTVAGNEALVLYGARQYPDINFYGLNPGLIKSNIRSNISGGQGSIRHRITEGIIGILTMSADTYARRIVPLLFSTDIESASGAFFNQKAIAILPSEIMTQSYVNEYIEASDKLLMRLLQKVPSP
jgi:NAD(P)-dependent dehydrogenase (short-subunit alcohol dehydrogenase family)